MNNYDTEKELQLFITLTATCFGLNATCSFLVAKDGGINATAEVAYS